MTKGVLYNYRNNIQMIVWLQERVNDMLSQELCCTKICTCVSLKTNNIQHDMDMVYLNELSFIHHVYICFFDYIFRLESVIMK